MRLLRAKLKIAPIEFMLDPYKIIVVLVESKAFLTTLNSIGLEYFFLGRAGIPPEWDWIEDRLGWIGSKEFLVFFKSEGIGNPLKDST